MQLPEKYIENMKQLLSDEEYRSYEACLSEPRRYGLRVNTSKISVEDFLDRSPFQLTKIPYVKNGFFYEKEEQPAKHPYYYAGLYYLQEPSAMLPADRFPIEQGDRVLDLCAAPGGKSTELAAKISEDGILVANDISFSRAQALLKNLEIQGASSFYVTAESPQKLAEKFPEFFDKILVDAPCSGEGMFRKDAALIKDWMQRGPDYYAPLQTDIVLSALKMLKKGGMLLYSTCTFSEKEDEQVIKTLLSADSDLSTVEIEPYEGFSNGHLGLKDCVRVFPHKMEGEGHFLALLKKGINEKQSATVNANERYVRKNHLDSNIGSKIESKAFDEFCLNISYSIDRNRIMRLNNMLYLLPRDYLDSYRGQLRYLRSGSLLGELDKKGNFKPSQALAMQLSPDTYHNFLNLSIEDDRVYRYLRGETIFYSEQEACLEKGDVLICTDGFALGWGKRVNAGSIKNKYRPEWRMV